jgi:hypothetical protein
LTWKEADPLNCSRIDPQRPWRPGSKNIPRSQP